MVTFVRWMILSLLSMTFLPSPTASFAACMSKSDVASRFAWMNENSSSSFGSLMKYPLMYEFCACGKSGVRRVPTAERGGLCGRSAA